MSKNFMARYTDEQVLFKHEQSTVSEINAYAPHSHAVCEILMLVNGSAYYTVRGKRYKVRKYDLILTRPSELHTIYPKPDTLYERYNLLFDEKTLPFNIWEVLPPDTDVLKFRDVSGIVELFRKMDFYAERVEGNVLSLMLQGIARELFVHILLEASRADVGKDFEQTNETVYGAVQYIDRNLQKICDIEEIANAMFVTKSHLHHLFVQYMGISPKKYIVSKRLALAQQEIFAGEKPTEIFDKYGFSDYSAFYRAYKKQFGKSPADKTTLHFGAEELF